ncbi:MAG: hypothetical protein AAGB00_05465, partial [Planctomycetota bacterium]
EDVALKRRQGVASPGAIDPDRVVFLDVTWAKTNPTRTRGRSEKRSRPIEKTPRGRRGGGGDLSAARKGRTSEPKRGGVDDQCQLSVDSIQRP